jgi:hypothetical protein
MSHDDETLERLLAKGHLSGAAYDQIEARVMARTAGEPRPQSRQWWWAFAASACGASALVFALAGSEPPAASSGFTAKGAPAVPGLGSVELACSNDGRPCRRGDTLLFVVDSGLAAGFLSASAVRVEPPSVERIWFFPTSGGEAPFIAAGTGTVVASQGVRIGQDQVPGLYRVDIRFTPEKPTRVVIPEAREGFVSVTLRIED